MFRAKTFSRSGNKTRVYAKPKDRRKAIWMLLSGVLGFLVLGGSQFFSGSDATATGSAAGLYGIIALAIGGIYLLTTSGGTVFDSTARTISGGPEGVSYDSFAAVSLRKEIVEETSHSDSGTTTYHVTYYCIDLIHVDKGYDIGEVALASATDEGLSYFLSIPGWRVAMHTGELQMWRLSERIARELQVLHVDAIGHPAVTRFASELDTPLVDLVGRRVAVPPGDDKPKEGILALEGSDSRIGFGISNPLVGVLVISCIPTACLAIAGFTAPLPIMGKGAAGLCGLFALAAIFMHLRPRRAELHVNSERIVLNPGWGFRRKMSLKSLESIRTESDLIVSLLSDRKVLRFQLADYGAERIRDEVVRALARTRDLQTQQSPYR